ncbi:T6SS phospholipase effector Tle1-like catalytic domain-containing protein [Pseudomonas sp. MBLB4123]|uniref:T6SS phospholipase effector Tle1-like catalytic domain-containing protein n=1 Tax=Pseudomonas sp. MBLB4123 TaxID=3451557 RepID=UPI003F7513ED
MSLSAINNAFETSKKISAGQDDGALCCEIPQIIVGIFFDGTGNNKENDRKSSTRALTNIAKLSDLYDQDNETKFLIYTQGIGTLESKDDSLLGLGFGIGSTGGEARLHEARTRLHDLVLKKLPQSVGEIVFDVFGFSRGAALARHFVNMIRHGLPDFNGKKETVSLWDVKLNPNLLMARKPYSQHQGGRKGPPRRVVDVYPRSTVKTRVRFVGLYDSVGSFYWPGNDDEGNFNLNLKAESAQYVYHLVAGQEVREKFPLTSVKNGAAAPSHFVELTGVGVHSDIGGGYADPARDSANIERVVRERYSLSGFDPKERAQKHAFIAQARAKAAANGWTCEVRGNTVYLIDERHTRPQLAHLGLHRMHQEALSRQVPLLELPDDELHRIPDDLKPYAELSFDTAGHASALAAIEALDPPYIHTSAFRYPLGVEQLPHTPEKSGTRRIFPNLPEQAS